MTIERRNVGPRDVLIEIDACGVCHSDIHQAEADWAWTSSHGPRPRDRRTRHSRRSDVTTHCDRRPRRRGLLRRLLSRLPRLRGGDENYCPDWSTTYNGYERDGVTRPTAATPTASWSMSTTSCGSRGSGHSGRRSLLCAGITVYPPLKDYAGPGKEIGVIGLGGLAMSRCASLRRWARA